MPLTHIKQRAHIDALANLEQQLIAALAAHGEWKFRLLKGIETGCKDLEPEKIRVDNACVFGQWLYSDATQPYRDTQHYRTVRNLHAEFHRQAAQVVDTCRAGDNAKARQLISGDYTAISNELGNEIKKWRATLLIQGGEGVSQSETTSAEAEELTRWQRRYGLLGLTYGAVAGVGFILVSLALATIQQGLPIALESLAVIHQNSWPQWVVDLAPLVLGGVGYYLGLLFGAKKLQEHHLESEILRRTEQLLASQREMQRMRDALSEGVFLLHKDKTIGAEYSKALEQIVESVDLSGKSLLETFAGRVDAQTLSELDGYLDLLFDASHSEAMLAPLNPFNPLRLDATAGFDEKIIVVEFRRVLDAQGKNIEGILGVAHDVTKRVLAERQAANARAKQNEQLELIGRILEIGPQMLGILRRQVRADLSGANDAMRNADPQALAGSLDAIYRHIHTIKGSSALLGITTIARAAHDYEDMLSTLRKKAALTTADFLPLASRQANLENTVAEFEGLLEKITAFQSSQQQAANEQDLLFTMLKNAAKQAASDTRKELELAVENENAVELPAELIDRLRPVLLQLIRNSAAHGIEKAEERADKGKDPVGKIRIRLEQKSDKISVIYSDDGQGIDAEKIKARAIDLRLINPEEAKSMDSAAVYKLLFLPGFSTRSEADETAGRGVGMDIVMQTVRELGGRLAMHSQVGQGLKISMHLPAVKVAST